MTKPEQTRVDGLAPLFLAVSCSTTRRQVSVLLGTALGHTRSLDLGLNEAVELFRGLSAHLRYLGVDVDALYPIDAINQ
ncbi:hypothetical protein [Allokutzneria oryzae]|uniref:Uncharacterized protein n=1 Tax=Allokutzneria oryzae TaxID=1378989 RepID=A0ABV6A931_9PSEU